MENNQRKKKKDNMDGTINENITIEGTGAGGNSKKRASEGGGDHKNQRRRKRGREDPSRGRGDPYLRKRQAKPPHHRH